MNGARYDLTGLSCINTPQVEFWKKSSLERLNTELKASAYVFAVIGA